MLQEAAAVSENKKNRSDCLGLIVFKVKKYSYLQP